VSSSMSAAVPDDRSFRVVEAVLDGVEAPQGMSRRRWSDDFKAGLVARTLEPGANVSAIAREAGIVPSLLFEWRRHSVRNGKVRSKVIEPAPCFVEAEAVAPVVEIVIGDIVVRAGADVGQDHLRRVIRAVRSA
jgi:transposase